MPRPSGSLVLSNGTALRGEVIGMPLISSGEMVFTTAMVGYSEALTDPSYFGQILTFAYPLIGNYGIPNIDAQNLDELMHGFESDRVHTAGVIVSTDSDKAYHWSSSSNLHHWLEQHRICGMVGIDTRYLVQAIRDHRQLSGRIVPDYPVGEADLGGISFDHREGFFDPGAQNIVQRVSVDERVVLGKGNVRIGLIDCGVKWNILRQLIELGCEIELLPWDTPLQSVDCSAWLISNGPGNPVQTGELVSHVGGLLSSDRPVLGICLGHQILSLAAGAKTRKMPYGHRSHNQPVIEVGKRRGHITSQNHGYVVCEEDFPSDWEVWFRNINDQTIEGIRHRSKPFRSVQFHPESCGGPRDAAWILSDFVRGAERV